MGAAQALAFAAGGLAGAGATDLARLLLPSAAAAYGLVLVAEAVLFLLAARQAVTIFGGARPAPAAADFSLTAT